MEMAEQGGAELRIDKASGGALCGSAEAAPARPVAGDGPVLAGRARLLAVRRAADGGAAAEADKAKPKGKDGAVLEDNREFIRERIRARIRESVRARIRARIREDRRERIREDLDYDLRVHLPQTLARANALQMAFDSC